MELKAIMLFMEFPYVNVLYRAFDGEYFVELDDVQAYLIGVGGGAYTVINRVTPLPPLPEPLPDDSPIWVLINNPVTSNGLRYDGVISYTNTTVGSLGAVTFVVNKVGAFRVGNYIFAISRKGASAGMLKYGQITAINSNNLSINFLEFEGTGNLENDEWDIVLTGKRGAKGDVGLALYGYGHPIVNVLELPAVGTIYINKVTFGVYERSVTNVIGIPSPTQDYSDGYWLLIGTLKGGRGDNGLDATLQTKFLSFDEYILSNNDNVIVKLPTPFSEESTPAILMIGLTAFVNNTFHAKVMNFNQISNLKKNRIDCTFATQVYSLQSNAFTAVTAKYIDMAVGGCYEINAVYESSGISTVYIKIY